MRKKHILTFLILLSVFLVTSCVSENEQPKEKYSPNPTSIVTEKPVTEMQANSTYLQEETTEISYIGNKKSKKFHSPDCCSLPAEKNRVEFSSRDEAVNRGYSPCGNCCP
ncbi:MAG: Ada metal-binding domain-containing protein [Hominilimicola sp.]